MVEYREIPGFPDLSRSTQDVRDRVLDEEVIGKMNIVFPYTKGEAVQAVALGLIKQNGFPNSDSQFFARIRDYLYEFGKSLENRVDVEMNYPGQLREAQEWVEKFLRDK